MVRRLRVLFVALAIATVGGLAAAGSAGAQQEEASGSGFAVSVAGPVLSLPPAPAGVSGAGTGGFAPVTSTTPVLSVSGLATVAQLAASTDGTPATGQPARVTSAASLGTLSVAAGLVRTGTAASTCTATLSGTSASSVVEALSVAGVAIPVASAPNTVVDVPGVLHGVLDEQVPDLGPGRSGVTVRAAHVQVLPSASNPALLDVVVAESSCLVTGRPGSPVTPPTTARPPATTRPGRRTTVPTTTAPPTSTTAATAVPTTLAPGPAGIAPAPGPPPAAPAVRATAADRPGAASGAAGSELDVAVTGFEGCTDVRLRFDHSQIGRGRPDATGQLAVGGVAVPGDTAPGAHTVTAVCLAPARLLRATASFTVVTAPAHRSAFVTSLAEPRQLVLSARSVLIGVVVTLGLMLAIAFPSELFNSTLDENYDEVRGWFGLKPLGEATGGGRHALAFVAFVLLGGLLYGFLSPDLGLDRSSVALVLGLSLSLVVISVGFRLPHLIYLHHRDGEWPRFRVLPGTAIVAVVCVAISRLAHFQPGYLYGLIAGLSFRRRLETDTNGELTAVSAISVFLISIAAWVARVPVSTAAARPHARLWLVGLEACLAAVTILGLETVVICLIPVRFVEGRKLVAWSRTAWAVVFALCAFAFVEILLRPDSGYVAASTSRLTVLVLFLGFGVLSIGFWAYFRYRPARVGAPPA